LPFVCLLTGSVGRELMGRQRRLWWSLTAGGETWNWNQTYLHANSTLLCLVEGKDSIDSL
jgi:hypothetical protein